MLFFGLVGDEKKASLDCALIEIRGKEDYEVLAHRSANLPGEMENDLSELLNRQEAALARLGQLDSALGGWIGAEALECLNLAGISAQAVELTGCQGFQLPGGLSLGDLSLASQRSGLVICMIRSAENAETCAREAWELWQQSRQNPSQNTGMAAATEGRNPATRQIDQLSTLEALRLINREDERVPRAVSSQLPNIAQAIDRITERMRQGGRLIYVGAGTSGRIGVLDASEIPPTYGASPDLVVAVIAGGEQAIQHSLEGVEDDVLAGKTSMQDLHVDEHDSVVGIAASGRTPFVLGAMDEARGRGALTVSLACNSPAVIEERADIVIAPLVGPEVITGSTRMKAGTAQKLTLNMISTTVMIRLGKTYSNLMVDMQMTNSKLRKRAIRIVAQACEIDESAAEKILEAAGGEVKTAIVSCKAKISIKEARARLEKNGGMVRAAFEQPQEPTHD